MNSPTTPRGFEALWHDNYADVLAFVLRRIDDRDAAADVVSETFLVAWRRRDALPRDTRPWLFGVARRVLANTRRSQTRQRALVVRLERQDDPRGVVGDLACPDSLPGRVAEAFNTLKEGDREVLRLVAWDDLTPAEAARVMGISPARFSVRLHRAKQRLRTAVGTRQPQGASVDASSNTSSDLLKEST